jgi:hypothetical protein
MLSVDMLSIVMLYVITLSVIMLNVIILNVVAPQKWHGSGQIKSGSHKFPVRDDFINFMQAWDNVIKLYTAVI